MLQFLANNGGTILVSVLLAVIVVAVARYMIRQKKQGNSSCGCGCEHCSSHCHTKHCHRYLLKPCVLITPSRSVLLGMGRLGVFGGQGT